MGPIEAPRIETQPPPGWVDPSPPAPPLLRAPGGEQVADAVQWEAVRARLEADWRAYLGRPPFAPFRPQARVCATHDWGDHRGWLIALQTEPAYWEQAYLMLPWPLPPGRLPAVVVFYYDVDTPSGHFLGSRLWQEGQTTRQFARHLVTRGYATLALRWFFEGYSVSVQPAQPATADLRARYLPAVERQARVAPGWKGLGRVVWDAAQAVTFLQAHPAVDPHRIGAMGHSLGGKMALYAGAFDPRLRVVVASEPGIGLADSNWTDPWYLGPEAGRPDFGRDHHQLLALLAPRPFLLIAGESADGERSWRYLNAARAVYALYGAAGALGLYNHRRGHTPTPEALAAAYAWFDRYLLGGASPPLGDGHSATQSTRNGAPSERRPNPPRR